jgi:hypothetical protein
MFTITLGGAIAALGGQALFLASVGWLVKTLVSQRLTKEADEFKITLQSRADVEIERIKASLQMVATEHQVRFAKLHERRAMVIAELYGYLVETPAHAGEFIFQNVRDREQAAKAQSKVWELYRFINLNRIYLPEPVCVMLDKFESILRKSILFVDVHWTQIEHPTTQTIEDRNKVMLEACSALESDLPAIRTELVKEFRVLLGETA